MSEIDLWKWNRYQSANAKAQRPARETNED